MIKVFEPILDEEDVKNALDALRSGAISGTYGNYISQFESEFAKYCGCTYGVATSSGSTALHLAMATLAIQDGDEVIVSSSTNIATGNAVAMVRGTIVPIDVERDTWNLDPSLLPEAISSKTKAILPVHLYGHPVDMDRVNSFAKEHDLMVIEDAAEAHGALYRGSRVGSLSDIACFSFYANKIITTGEGGMLVTDNPEYAKRASYLRNLAFSEPRFVHHEIGFNYRMTNLQAAIGLAQLQRIDQIIERKRTIAETYMQGLAQIPGLKLPAEMDYAFNVYWMFAMVVNSEFGISRDELINVLAAKGIETRTFFCPLNLQPCYISGEFLKRVECPVAESLWQSGLYLPSGTGLSDSEISHVIEAIKEASRLSR